MSVLRDSIIRTFGLTEGEFIEIQNLFKPKKIQKGDYFLQIGQYVNYLSFVESGILREFLYENDKEVTKWFSTSGSFAVDLSAFVYGQKSRVNFQAITDVSILTLTKDNYDIIGDKIPGWDKLEKEFLANCFSIMEDRVVSHLSLNAEERYHQFFKNQTELFNQVPLKQLASMLGMTPETLSRIRNKSSRSIS